MKVANVRDFKFQNGINFLVTASPGTFDACPSTNLATIKAVRRATRKTSSARWREQYPDITFLPVGDLLNQAADIFGQLSIAVNIVGALAVVNGLLVLAGTMAAGRKQREADAVVNKVLGSTPRRRGAGVRGRIRAARRLRGAAGDGGRRPRGLRDRQRDADERGLRCRPAAGGRSAWWARSC